MTVGSFGYRRLLGMDSAKLGDGSLLVAGEVGTYNGPWANPGQCTETQRLRALQPGHLDRRRLRHRHGLRQQMEFDASGAAARGRVRLSRSLRLEDPSDGGSTNRFALSGRIAQSDDLGSWKANAYVVKSQLDLFNNFTCFLSDPVLGDQFHQHDDRLMAGANSSRTLPARLVVAGLPCRPPLACSRAMMRLISR